jgi:hypothetical protein
MPSPIINIRFDVTAAGSIGSVGVFGTGFKFIGEAYGGAQFAAGTRPFAVTASGVIGIVGRADLVVPRRAFTLSATGTRSDNGQANMVAPTFISLFGVYRGTMPLFNVRGIGSETIAAVYQAYAVNIKNAALTEYTNFPFNHLARVNGQTIAFTDTGAYLLGAGDDDGSPIDALFELPPSDFQTSLLKRMPYIYLGTDSGEYLRISAVADERVTVASKTATIGRNRRAKMARGVKARFWAGRVENTGGEDFSVDSLEYLPMILKRKV